MDGTDHRFPLGAQLVPVVVCEPRMPSGSVWCFPEIPGIWFCGSGVWRGMGLRVQSWQELR